MDTRQGIIYTTEGDFKLLVDKPNIFRKMIGHSRETEIYKILLLNQDEIKKQSIGIVTIKELSDKSVDLELLDTNLYKYSDADIKKEMSKVKDYLQSIGIMYYDWKPCNIGISHVDGKLKLFDFDASGCIGADSITWIIEAPNWYAFNKAVNDGMKTPIDIDNYAFDNGFPDTKKYRCCCMS